MRLDGAAGAGGMASAGSPAVAAGPESNRVQTAGELAAGAQGDPARHPEPGLRDRRLMPVGTDSGFSTTVLFLAASRPGSSATRSGRAPRNPWTTVSGEDVTKTSLPAATSASSSKTAGLASWMSSTRISWRRSRSAARKSGESWNSWRAAVMMPAGSKASGMRRSRTSRYSAYRAAAAIQSGRPHSCPRRARSSAVRPDSMIRSNSWRTSCRKPRVGRAASRSAGQGSPRPGRAWPSSSSLMMRSCSGPDRRRGASRQRQEPFSLGAADQIEGVGRPGAGRGGAQAPVQPWP